MYSVFIAIISAVFVSGCVATPQEPLTVRNSQLTHGNVQMNLKIGETSKAAVIENFGAPNVVTRDGSGHEVWTYQRQAQVTQSSKSEGYWTLLLAGKESSSSGFESSSRMITLIIKFDENDIVSDFSSRSSNF